MRRTRKRKRATSCNGKLRQTQGEALAVVRARKGRGAVRINAYKCRFCGYWHTGNRR